MTKDEFKMKLGYKRPATNEIVNYTVLDETTAPASIDWRTKGAVTGVKDQGQCGSCWAFSAIGSLEGHHQIATGNLVSLSEQQIVDCSHEGGSQGCNGGFMNQALTYAISHKIMKEADYGYTATDGSCKYNAAKGVFTAKQVFNVQPNKPAQLKAAAALGPVTIAIEAD
jgi:C1A family cysteine protease